MELHEFFLALAMVLLGTRLLAETASRLGIPAVIGELTAGLILGLCCWAGSLEHSPGDPG